MPGLLGAGRRLRPRRRAHERRVSTATTSSSTARRSGRRSRTSPTSASCSRAATPTPQRHDGLTYMIVDMQLAGRRGAPAAADHGRVGVQRDLLHGRARCPRENVLGEIGGGWQVAMTTLLHERGTLGFALQAALEIAVRKLLALARERGATPLQRDRIAREWIELQALRVTNLRSLTALVKTGIPGPGGIDREAAVVGGEPAADEARARAARPAGAAARRRTRRSTATGSTSSCAAAATRSRPAPPRSSATSSPSACSGSPAPADGRRLRTRAGGAAPRGPRVPGGDARSRPGRSSRSSAGPASPSPEEQGGAGLGFLEEAVARRGARPRARPAARG